MIRMLFKLSLEKAVPISLAASKLIRLSAVFMLMTSISDQEFGLWVTCSLLLQYTVFLQLGIPAPASRESAIALGRGESDKSDSFKVVALRVQNVAAAIIIFVGALMFADTANVWLIIGYIICSHFSALIVTLARFSLRYRAVVISQLSEAVIIGSLVLWKFPSLSVPFLLGVYLFASVVSACICLPATNILKRSLRPDLSWVSECKALLPLALPLLAFTFLILFRGTWDIIVVGLLGSESQTGFVAAQSLADSFRILAALLMSVFVPTASFLYGNNKEVISEQLSNYLEKFIMLTVCIACLLITATLCIGDFLLNFFLPQYQNFSQFFFYKIVALAGGLISMPYYSFLTAVRKVADALLIISLSLVVGLMTALGVVFYTDLISAVLIGSVAASYSALGIQRVHFKVWVAV